MTFEIKLANGHTAEFDNAAELADWYERMVPRVNKPRKDAVDSKKVAKDKIEAKNK